MTDWLVFNPQSQEELREIHKVLNGDYERFWIFVGPNAAKDVEEDFQSLVEAATTTDTAVIVNMGSATHVLLPKSVITEEQLQPYRMGKLGTSPVYWSEYRDPLSKRSAVTWASLFGVVPYDPESEQKSSLSVFEMVDGTHRFKWQDS